MAMVLAALIVLGEQFFDGRLLEVSSFEGAAGEEGIDKFLAQFMAEPSAQGDAKALLGPPAKWRGH